MTAPVGTAALSGTRLGRLTIRGRAITGDLAARVVGVPVLSMSTDAVTETTVVFDDSDEALADAFPLGAQADYAGLLPFEAAAVELSDASGTRLLTVTLRGLATQRLRRLTAPSARNTTAQRYAADLARRAAARFVGQGTPGRTEIVGTVTPGQPPQTALDLLMELAAEEGVLAFEAANVLHFAKPTYLVARLPRITIDATPSRRDPGLLSVTARRTADDPDRPATVTLQVVGELAERLRPGNALTLRGWKGYDATYLITALSLPLSEAQPATITAVSPVDPVPTTDSATVLDLGLGGTGLLEQALAGSGTSGGTITIESYLAALRTVESGGDYRIQSRISSASGAYQYIDSTWNNFGGFPRAYLAPKAVQDQRARQDTERNYGRYGGDWERVACAHFFPVAADDDKSTWNRVPAPGNPTIRSYVDSVISKAVTAGVLAPSRTDVVTLKPPLSSVQVTSGYGPRGSGFHYGLDLAAAVGTPVLAAATGVVEVAGERSGYGIAVYLNHGQGVVTRYGHLSQLLVGAGQTVRQGQVIAKSGNTGRSTGPHLHFELRRNGIAADPGPALGFGAT